MITRSCWMNRAAKHRIPSIRLATSYTSAQPGRFVTAFESSAEIAGPSLEAISRLANSLALAGSVLNLWLKKTRSIQQIFAPTRNTWCLFPSCAHRAGFKTPNVIHHCSLGWERYSFFSPACQPGSGTLTSAKLRSAALSRFAHQ